jgi:hypothetical protein
MKRALLATTMAVVLSSSVTARADQAVLESVRDTTIYENANGSLSNGSGNRFFSGRKMNFGIIDRGLVRFEVAGNIPCGATILSIELQLNMTNSNAPIAEVSLHRVLADWGEAGSNAAGTGASAETGDATWLHTFFDTSFWMNVGGDFVAAPSATQSVDQEGFYMWCSTSEMIADVQAWLDSPETNFGWIVIGDESAEFSDKAYATREHENPAWRPQLTVTYDLLPGGVDTDGDGVRDSCDTEPDDPNLCQDLDRDGCDDCSMTGADGSGGDPFDDGPDGDADGVCDAGDNCPGDANADQADTDADGVGDACDPDDDNDGVPDIEDGQPLNPFVCRDLDLDGCDDCSRTVSDGSGGDPLNDGVDTDGDGVCDDGDDDDDNDGVADAEDGQRLIPFACRDLDQDGCDDCSVSGADGSGGDPLNDGVDTDGDGACDGGDDDDDNDGVSDADDSHPQDPFVCRDLDQDGCQDCSVTGANGSGGDAFNDGPDADGDGVCDLSDNCPGISNADQADADGDGVGDACDGDGDGAASGDDSADGVPQGGLFSFCSPSPMATLSATLLTLVGLRLRIRGRVRRRKVV